MINKEDGWRLKLHSGSDSPLKIMIDFLSNEEWKRSNKEVFFINMKRLFPRFRCPCPWKKWVIRGHVAMPTLRSESSRLQKIEKSFNRSHTKWQLTQWFYLIKNGFDCFIWIDTPCLFDFNFTTFNSSKTRYLLHSKTLFLLNCNVTFISFCSDGCGIRANTQTRIVGGEISYPGKWPWMAGNKCLNQACKQKVLPR